MAHAISTWVDDFKSIRVDLLDDDCFRVGSQIGKKLLGMEDSDVVEDKEIVTTLTQARDDEEEYSQDWIDDMEKMMAAYDKKKTINTSFARPSFVLDRFDCPDPFATQQTEEAGVSGGGGLASQVDDRANVAPVVDQPGDEEHQGDMAMLDPLGDDIHDIIYIDDGVAGLEVPAEVQTSAGATATTSHMTAVGGERSKAGVSVNTLNTLAVTLLYIMDLC